MIRISIKPLPSQLSTEADRMYISNDIYLLVEDMDANVKLLDVKLLECKVSRDKGTTSYEAIPPANTIGKLHEQPWEEQMKAIVQAYFDGREDKEHYSWTWTWNNVN